MDDPHREPEILHVTDALDGAVTHPHVLVADPFEAEVGMTRAQLAGTATARRLPGRGRGVR